MTVTVTVTGWLVLVKGIGVERMVVGRDMLLGVVRTGGGIRVVDGRPMVVGGKVTTLVGVLLCVAGGCGADEGAAAPDEGGAATDEGAAAVQVGRMMVVERWLGRAGGVTTAEEEGAATAEEEGAAVADKEGAATEEEEGATTAAEEEELGDGPVRNSTKRRKALESTLPRLRSWDTEPFSLWMVMALVLLEATAGARLLVAKPSLLTPPGSSEAVAQLLQPVHSRLTCQWVSFLTALRSE